mmetsp:Transcript_36588/g.71953  ORF Transcript_36588/g.71953 Transcript_36588/m.71953 type:complete len:210 (-) Transcript_36588:216-845(-)
MRLFIRTTSAASLAILNPHSRSTASKEEILDAPRAKGLFAPSAKEKEKGAKKSERTKETNKLRMTMKRPTTSQEKLKDTILRASLIFFCATSKSRRGKLLGSKSIVWGMHAQPTKDMHPEFFCLFKTIKTEKTLREFSIDCELILRLSLRIKPPAKPRSPLFPSPSLLRPPGRRLAVSCMPSEGKGQQTKLHGRSEGKTFATSASLPLQ